MAADAAADGGVGGGGGREHSDATNFFASPTQQPAHANLQLASAEPPPTGTQHNGSDDDRNRGGGGGSDINVEDRSIEDALTSAAATAAATIFPAQPMLEPLRYRIAPRALIARRGGGPGPAEAAAASAELPAAAAAATAAAAGGRSLDASAVTLVTQFSMDRCVRARARVRARDSLSPFVNGVRQLSVLASARDASFPLELLVGAPLPAAHAAAHGLYGDGTVARFPLSRAWTRNRCQ